jgi:3-hydroxyacyl-CoA dehydrogenase
MEGVASIESIDDTMKIGYGLQFGPFELLTVLVWIIF